MGDRWAVPPPAPRGSYAISGSHPGRDSLEQRRGRERREGESHGTREWRGQTRYRDVPHFGQNQWNWPEMRDATHVGSFDPPDDGVRCATDSGGIGSNGVQDRLDIGGGNADDAQDLAGRRLLLYRLGERALQVPHTTALAGDCRRGAGEVSRTLSRTPRARGCPAGTGDTASGVWAAKGRDGGPRLDCCQPGGQPQGVS
jgi:hypothetical protein